MDLDISRIWTNVNVEYTFILQSPSIRNTFALYLGIEYKYTEERMQRTEKGFQIVYAIPCENFSVTVFSAFYSLYFYPRFHLVTSEAPVVYFAESEHRRTQSFFSFYNTGRACLVMQRVWMCLACIYHAPTYIVYAQCIPTAYYLHIFNVPRSL